MAYSLDWGTALREAVRQAHSKFLAGMSFEIVEDSGDILVVESRCCRLRISWDRACVIVDIEPLRLGRVKNDEVELTWVLDALAPGVPFEVGFLRFPEQIAAEVDRQIGLLVEHCRPVLLGDPESWLIVERKLELAANAPPIEEPELTDEERIARLRRRAQEAYDGADYVYTFTCYSVLEDLDTLTKEEQRQYEEAERWLDAAGPLA